jgi:Sulfotransferase domain
VTAAADDLAADDLPADGLAQDGRALDGGPPDLPADVLPDFLPDFLIVGAMKCGTTTLQAQLAAQPGVFMTTPKEPNFFSDDAVFARGADWYAGLFAAAPPGARKGEASTHYTKLPTHPLAVPRMQALLPVPPRIVYVIRDPVERALSHYIHAWSKAQMGADPAEAFRRHPELVDYGRYAMQIAPYLAAFGPGSVLLTSLEQMNAGPQAELARIAAHVGVAGPVRWQEAIGAQNVSAGRVRRLPLQALLIDNPVAEALRRTLVPKRLRDAVRNARRMDRRPSLPDGLRSDLETRFLADRAELARLFPGHPALRLCYPFAPAGPAQG